MLKPFGGQNRLTVKTKMALIIAVCVRATITAIFRYYYSCNLFSLRSRCIAQSIIQYDFILQSQIHVKHSSQQPFAKLEPRPYYLSQFYWKYYNSYTENLRLSSFRIVSPRVLFRNFNPSDMKFSWNWKFPGYSKLHQR